MGKDVPERPSIEHVNLVDSVDFISRRSVTRTHIGVDDVISSLRDHVAEIVTQISI